MTSKKKLYGINYQIVAAPVNCSKLVVTIATRSARVLEGTETGQRLTVEGVHSDLVFFSHTERDELFVLSQLEQSKNFNTNYYYSFLFECFT